MNKKVFCVIDVGTSALKAALMAEDGTVIRSSRKRLFSPMQNISNFHAFQWIEALCGACAELLAASADIELAALVMSGNGPTLTAVNDKGNVIGNPLVWLDQRVSSGENTASFYLSQLRWFETYHQEKARWYLPLAEYLIYWLTGEVSAITPNEDFQRFIWTPDECEAHGVSADALPPFVTTGSVVGYVRAIRAEETHVPSGLPVVAGGLDYCMSLIGTNTMQAGECCDRCGTSEGINYCTAVPKDTLQCLPHVVSGLYNISGVLSASGLLFEWLRKISGKENSSYDEMTQSILHIAAHVHIPMFFPSVHHDALWEFKHGTFVHLGAEHGLPEIGKAVVLSIAFGVRMILDALHEAGCSAQILRTCGGQARNGLWMQTKADILGIPIAVPHVIDAELTGNLCVGLTAFQAFSSIQEASNAVVKFAQTYEPNMQHFTGYTEQYMQYKSQYEKLCGK